MVHHEVVEAILFACIFSRTERRRKGDEEKTHRLCVCVDEAVGGIARKVAMLVLIQPSRAGTRYRLDKTECRE